MGFLYVAIPSVFYIYGGMKLELYNSYVVSPAKNILNKLKLVPQVAHDRDTNKSL